MANIDEALPQLYRNEGGYSKVPGDSGGETYRGISRNNWGSWRGWALVDAAKPLKDEQIIDNPELNILVRDFYKDNFWDTNNLEEIKAQSVANKIMDMAVNMGSYRAGMILQQALMYDFRCQINIDGKIGRETIAAVNKQGAGYLLTALRRRSVEFYEGVAERKPETKKFLNGWLKRAEQ